MRSSDFSSMTTPATDPVFGGSTGLSWPAAGAAAPNSATAAKIRMRIIQLRVPICKGGLSGCQTGSFDSGKVQAVAEEFDKDYGFGGSCQKLRKGMAEGNGDDLFGGCQSWPNGSNPGAE